MLAAGGAHQQASPEQASLVDAFNLLGLKPKIDDWFAEAAPEALTYESLTNRIYAEVFLMPLSDPWLGLSPNDEICRPSKCGPVRNLEVRRPRR